MTESWRKARKSITEVKEKHGMSLQESIEQEQKISAATKKNIRRASITIDAILKLNPSLAPTGPVVSVDDDVDGDKSVEEKKVKAKKNRRKSLSDMCKDSSGKLTNDYWSKLQSRLKIEDSEEENDENENKDDEFNKKFEASIANKEIVVEEQSL
ncbi:hypothetical protein HOP50_10g59110 [Chloropicon primus]|uniref:Uncharacterized protein n=1 Tax=Chloropicon primus TaxID=1764295 RepID=A0A5B8MSC7_9CHLO|nr:hypothetical protein A3770_10p58910 [Chloropicon primus]UPR02585.1 hypothetical protein HOP50_10g59110 [Chloropicon primus]|eukprot:QDZ23373.1 hypothetical protein A3770_10p58910 [Chloropicon primus]